MAPQDDVRGRQKQKAIIWFASRSIAMTTESEATQEQNALRRDPAPMAVADRVLDAAWRQADVAQRSAIERLGAGELPPHAPFAMQRQQEGDKAARQSAI